MSFSPDGKWVIAQGGAPEWNVTLWNWERCKQLACVPAKALGSDAGAVLQVRFSAHDTSLASCAGEGVFRTFKCAESGVRALPDVKLPPAKSGGAGGAGGDKNYTAHCWLPDDSEDKGDDSQGGTERRERCVLGTDTGELLVIELNEVKAHIPAIPGDSKGIDCVIPYGVSGFVCGGADGTVGIYEKTDEKELYRRVKQFVLKRSPNARVTALALSPTDETLLCQTDDNQTYEVDMSNVDVMKSEDIECVLFTQGHHTQGVTGVDLCVRKPLAVTCSSDRSVRVWNYLDKADEIVKFFPEEASSVAFHPSGLHVLVGFADKLRLCNLLMDDIRPYREFSIKGCRECSFSNGGKYFAAVNGSVIQVYNMYTCENVGNCRGHGGKVTGIAFSADDKRLVSTGLDGAVYEWSLSTFQRDKENVLKSNEYTSVCVAPDDGFVFGVGSDATLKQFDGEDLMLNEEFKTNGATLTQVRLTNGGRQLFAATDSGAVRIYRLDGGAVAGEKEYQELQCHAGPVTGMRVNFDDTLLFCVGDDGVLSVFDIKERMMEGAAKAGEGMVFAQEVLMTKADLEDIRNRMHELEVQVNELTLQGEYQLRLKDLNMNEKIKDLTDKFQGELDGERSKHEALLQEKNELEMDFEDQMKTTENKHAQAMGATESSFQNKILNEIERYQALVEEKEELNRRWDEQSNKLAASHERVMAELTEEFGGKLQDEQMHSETLRAQLEDARAAGNERENQLEEDADLEIDELKEKYELKLKEQRDVSLRLKGENGIMKKKFTAMTKSIAEQKDEIAGLFTDKKNLYATIADLEKDVAGLKREIRDRDETIGDKEKRIYDLKKKNQELEKFKFVLDFKIKELKRTIEPREQDISDMKAQITEMDKELERYNKSNTHLDLTIKDLRNKLLGMGQDVKRKQKAIEDRDSAIHSFQKDLHEATKHVQTPKRLAEEVKSLHAKHMTQNIDDKPPDKDIQREYNRQREYLEKTVDQFKRKLAKDVETHKKDNMALMNQNVALIKEINELRRETKMMRQSTSKPAAKAPTGASSRLGSRAPSRGGLLDDGFSREVESARVEIASLRVESKAKDARIAELEEYIAEGEAIVEPPLGKAGADADDAVRIPSAAAASEEMDEHAAATRIQAMHRGRVAREEVQVKKLVSGALDSVTQGDGS